MYLNILLADDTNMFGMDKNPETLVDKINSELSKIVSWLHANKMSLNIEKDTFYAFY